MSITKYELIGKNAEIIHNNKKHKGKIIDETKNTIRLREGQVEKLFFKNTITIIIDKTKIEGKILQKKPEERIKSRRKLQ